MAKNLLGPYRGYCGSAEFDLEGQVLFGKILAINDRILYEAQTPKTLEHAFKNAVDDYLALCEELGESPDRPYSGSVTIRFGEELHKCASIAASAQGISMNEYVVQAVSEKMANERCIVYPKQDVFIEFEENLVQWKIADFKNDVQVQAGDNQFPWKNAYLQIGTGAIQ